MVNMYDIWRSITFNTNMNSDPEQSQTYKAHSFTSYLVFVYLVGHNFYNVKQEACNTICSSCTVK